MVQLSCPQSWGMTRQKELCWTTCTRAPASGRMFFLSCLTPKITRNHGIIWIIIIILPSNFNVPFAHLRYVGAHAAVLDQMLLLGTTVPTQLTRRPRSLSHHLSYWKASEVRAWILYYSVPLLADYLPESYYLHWCCYVLAMWLLLSPSISPDDLSLAHLLLTFFCEQMAQLYGRKRRRHWTFPPFIDYFLVTRWGPLYHECPQSVASSADCWEGRASVGKFLFFIRRRERAPWRANPRHLKHRDDRMLASLWLIYLLGWWLILVGFL